MGIFYVLTVIAMIATFVLFKKSEKKQNLINHLILSVICYLGFNILVCMVFGCLNITTNLLFLSIADLIVAAGLGFKIYKDKGIQTFEIRKRDIAGAIICLLIVCYMAVDQYAPLSKTVANASVDACMHYSAATNFADEMKVLAKINNTTGYNFKTMQTGAYINTGIFMNIVRDIIPGWEDYVAFKVFETGITALVILAFYMLISDKLKDAKSYIVGMILLVLYAYAYPYTSLLHGFSYLSVCLMFATALFYMAKVYEKGEVNFWVQLAIIVLLGVGIIFSYCLFVPALFAFICIYVFIKDLGKKEEKSYLKIFKKSTLWITGLLLVVTIVSIFYLVIPTFTDSDQNKLTDAIGFEGGIYKSLYQDFLFYIPFVILFIYKTIKDKKINFQTIALCLIGGQTLLMLFGIIGGIVSPYYYYKMYFLLWILLVDIAVEVISDLDDNKEMYVMATSYLAIWVMVIMFMLTGLEGKLKEKCPNLFDPKAQFLTGIYYTTNVEGVLNIDASCLVDADRVKLAEAMQDVEDITLKNMVVGGMNTNCKAWMYVISRAESGGASINDLQYAVVETKVEDFLKDDSKKYFVLYTGEKYENTEDYEVVFQNKAGVILRKLEK
ncbi:MAG: hypothetical protein IJW20_05730 [Clostridia bacterium]|nr:hypothetical protein [Clostridia bacterium]